VTLAAETARQAMEDARQATEAAKTVGTTTAPDATLTWVDHITTLKEMLKEANDSCSAQACEKLQGYLELHRLKMHMHPVVQTAFEFVQTKLETSTKAMPGAHSQLSRMTERACS
jgi:hypothetical protein